MSFGFERHLFRKSGFGVCRVAGYWIRKLQARFFAGNYASAHRGPRRGAATASVDIAILLRKWPNMYFTARACPTPHPATPRQRYPAAAAPGRCRLRIHKQLQRWAANCPDNFENRAALVGARDCGGSKAGSSMPNASTNRPSARARANGFYSQRGARQRGSLPASYAARGFREDCPACICRMPATAISAGEPMARYGNSMKCIHISGRKRPAPAPTSTIGGGRSRHPRPRDRDQGCRRPSPARSSWKC